MNVAPAIAVTPTLSRELADGVSAAVWYPFHDATGLTVKERLGKGGPDLTLQAAITTDWANYGCITPPGTQYATAPVGNAVLNEIFDLTDINGQQVLIGWQQLTDGDQTGNEAWFGWGADRTAVGKKGGYTFNRSGAETVGFIVRPEQGTAATNSVANTGITGIAGLVSIVMALKGLTATTAELSVYTWDHTALNLLTGIVSPLDLMPSGVGVPGVDPDYSLTLMGYILGTTPSRLLNSTASNASLQNFWAARRTAIDAGAALDCLETIKAIPNTFPTALLK